MEEYPDCHVAPEDVIPWIWVTLIGRPVNKIITILQNDYNSIQNAYNAAKNNIISDTILKNKKLAQNMQDKNLLNRAIDIYEQSVKLGMRIIHKNMSQYPELLKHVSSAPAVLYCYGKAPCEWYERKYKLHSESCENLMRIAVQPTLISVVGARNCTAYGFGTALKLGRYMAEYGVGVISGMARGIDTAAHRGVIEAGGYTVAVLGSGADVVYPQENARLYHIIKEHGFIVSEYPPGTPPARYNFPARNRLIAGMSPAVSVIEAGITSGAMITAGLAGEMGRDVFAVPGNIDNPLSLGCNRLIQNGALCVTEFDDILRELGIYYERCDDIKYENIFEKNVDLESKIIPYDKESDEYIILKKIKEGVRETNQLSIATGIPAGRLQALLAVMEIKKIIKKHSDGIYFEK